MRIIPVLLAALLLTGCGSKPDQSTPESHLIEKSTTLPPDTMALRVAQQFAPGGVSNEVRLLMLGDALVTRNRAPSHSWSVESASDGTYLVKARLTALQRKDTEFQWKVDLSKPAHQVCEAANPEAESLSQLHVKLDETGLEDYLGPALPPPAQATPKQKP